MEYKAILFFGHIDNMFLDKLSSNGFANITANVNSGLNKEISSTIRKNKIPFIEFTNEQFLEWNIAQNSLSQYMSFFVDVKDVTALAETEQSMHKDNKEMAYTDASYILVPNDYEKSSKLIKKLWTFRNAGGVLSRELISLMINCGMLIINGKEESISNASYDLSLGDEYYYEGKISTLTNKKPFIQIEPYDYVIASCKEMTNFPRDISARFDISVNLFCQGIIMSNSTQVDPGFRGKLFCLLFNTSNKTIYLKKDTHFTTLEFHKLLEPTTPYSGKYNEKENILHYLPTNVMQGAINELKKEIEKLQKENKNMQNFILGLVSLFLGLIAILLVL